jgi:hypothetical protein
LDESRRSIEVVASTIRSSGDLLCALTQVGVGGARQGWLPSIAKDQEPTNDDEQCERDESA